MDSGDGVSVPALTGITTTRLISPIAFKGRFMFLEVNSLSFWYLSAGAAGGALTEFDLSGVAQMGGRKSFGIATYPVSIRKVAPPRKARYSLRTN